MELNGLYVANRLALILLYRFLQLMKNAQVSISQEYTSTRQILINMLLNRIFNIIIIFLNVLTIALLVIIRVLNAEGNKKMNRPFSMFISIFNGLVFILNTVTLCYYYKMGQFFME